MRITFVNRMAGMVRGGGETFDLEMARHLASLGCEITFLVGHPLVGRNRLGPKEWWGGSEMSEFGYRIADFRIRTPYLGWFPWDKLRGGWRVREWDFRMFEFLAARWILRNQAAFDVIQVCELPELVKQLKRRGCKKPVSMRMPGPHLFRGYGQGALEVADQVIASGTSIDFFQRHLAREVINIPNGVDTDLFAPDPTPAMRKSDAFTLVFVARMTAIKNHAMLLDAVRLLKARGRRVAVKFAGSGPLIEEVRRYARDNQLEAEVVVLGEVPYDQLPALYRSADLKVISSDYESFGFVALEAMSCGLPVVSTRTGWIPGLLGEPPVEGRSPALSVAPGGVIVPVKDAEKMAEAIAWMMDHQADRLSAGQWNRARVVADYSWYHSAQKLLEAYEAMVERQ